MVLTKVQQGLLDRLPQTCGGDWSHRLRGRDDIEAFCHAENVMRNSGIPLERRVELHGYTFWIYSGRAVKTATNVLKRKVKPKSGDVVVHRALTAAYGKVEKTFSNVRVQTVSGEYVVCEEGSDARGLLSATANPCMREDGLATWKKLAAAKAKWRNVAGLLADEIRQQHNVESDQGLSIHKLHKILRRSRTPTFGGAYSPLRFCRSLIAANAKTGGGDIVFQDTRDDWEKGLRKMGGGGISVRRAGCFRYEDACVFRDAVAAEERKLLSRDLLVGLPRYSLADLRQFLCLDKFGKAVDRKHMKQLAQKITKKRDRRDRSSEDRHQHRKKDVRVRKRIRVDSRVGRKRSDKRPRSDYR